MCCVQSLLSAFREYRLVLVLIFGGIFLVFALKFPTYVSVCAILFEYVTYVFLLSDESYSRKIVYRAYYKSITFQQIIVYGNGSVSVNISTTIEAYLSNDYF